MWAALMVVLSAAPTESGPRVAVLPLVIVGGDPRAGDQSRTDFIAEAARQPLQLVPPVQAADAAAAQPGGTCVDHPGCLEKVCAQTSAVYAVLATLSLNGDSFVATATVVAADGTVVRANAKVSKEKDLLSPRAQQVQALFRELFVQLDLSPLPTVLAPKAVVLEPKAVEPKQPDAPVVVVRPRHSNDGTPASRIAALIVGGVAAATAVAGVGLLVVANNERVELVDGTRILKNTEGNTEAAARRAEKFSVAQGVLGAAAVVGGTALVMMLLSSGSDESNVSISPLADGAVVGIRGTF